MPVPYLPQPRRDRDRHARRQARGHVAPRRRWLAYRAAQDHSRSECAADEEPNVFLLSGGTAITMNGTQGYRPGLVDIASGQISREIFVNDDIYAEEKERVFARSWLFVGHESQIPNPG